jgi:unsaturated rhamnogalacturonyl hydrolase
MKHFKILFIVMLSVVASVASCQSPQGKKKSPEPWSVKMASSEMLRNPDAAYLDFNKEPKWNYTNGLVCSAIEQVWRRTGDERFYNYVKAYADKMIDENGVIKGYKPTEYNIDKVNSGKFLFDLLEQTGDEKYRKALHALRDQMKTHPRTSEGGYWHKQIYPHQMWLDGLYMGSPFLAEYAKVFNEPALFDDVLLQIRLIDKHTYDSKSGLFYHAWDESKEQRWANKTDGKSPHVWGRAMGWFAMALVDVLDFLPMDHPGRKEVLNVADKMAQAVEKYQDKSSGVWFQVMDEPTRKGNYLESSASSMFTYFLVKGVKRGYIDKKYMATAKRGYDGIIKRVIKVDDQGQTHITEVCSVAGLGGNPYRDGTFEYYVSEPKRDNDPKAVGPFIMLALEFEEIQKSK